MDAANSAPPPEVAAQPGAEQRRRRWLPALAVTLVLLAGFGIAVASWAFGWFDNGRRPADVLPAQVSAYLELDLAPAPWQQLQAWSFLHDVPEVRAAGGRPEPKLLLWQLIGSRLGYADDVDFAVDVQPWLGDRAGFAIMAAPDEPTWMTAIELTDTDLGVATLKRWIGTRDQDYDVTAVDGYALITRGRHTDLVLAALEKGRLAREAAFSDELAAAGTPGFAALWADLGRLREPDPGNESLRGRVAATLTFSGDAATWNGHASGLVLPTIEAPGRLGELPASILAGFSVSGGAKAMPALWPSLDSFARAWPRWTQVTEGDVAMLLGSSFSVAVPKGGDLFDRDYDLRVTTEDPGRAEAALATIIADTEYRSLKHQVKGDVLVASRDAAALNELAGTGPRLADLPEFKRAVPDHTRAIASAYVDLRAAGWPSVEPDSAYAPFSDSIRALGGQYLPTGEGTGNWSIRLTSD